MPVKPGHGFHGRSPNLVLSKPEHRGVMNNNSRLAGNSKKRKRENSPESTNHVNKNIKSDQESWHAIKANYSSGITPVKKQKSTKKKETIVKKETKPKENKPVVEIKTPKAYSTNWQRLKEIITKDTGTSSKAKAVKKETRKNRENNKHQDIKGIKNNEKNQKKKENLVSGKPNDRQGSKVSHLKKRVPVPAATLKEDGESKDGVTDVVAMDCEMVGVGYDAKESMVARVSLVNKYGHQIYDKYVKPMEKVGDYRTFVSGIRPNDLVKGENFSTIQEEVGELIKGRTLVGHALRNDMKVLYLTHPIQLTRDTSRYGEFRKMFNGRTPSLKNLTEKVLGMQIQTGEHNSVQDAQAAMRLYMSHQKEWEDKKKKNKRIKDAMRRKSRGKGAGKIKNKEENSQLDLATNTALE
ncbi:hypothetical protein Pmani_014021 [Petrolisthes manimaculis]|uniref:RNA exonuclease 4 n=1 Tax=Petrolisthes manimaculis TaxID=1843537 RepID=A0AAE1PTN5_9EUCA|nr:hypothetical protein Pmani_014021 [Petrolisthes manimaculis]